MSSLLHAVMVATLASAGGDDATSHPSAERFDLLGVQVCLGTPDDGAPCHLRLPALPALDSLTTAPPAPPPAPTPAPVRFSVLGTTICLGPVDADAQCDVRLGDTLVDPRGDTEA